jgi:invasion protein IalB
MPIRYGAVERIAPKRGLSWECRIWMVPRHETFLAKPLRVWGVRDQTAPKLIGGIGFRSRCVLSKLSQSNAGSERSMKMYAKRVTGEWGVGARAGFAALMLAVGLGFAAAPALAQQKPAAKADATADKDKNFWVKLCEKAPSVTDPKKELNVCLTHHEQLESTTGMVLVSVAIRHIEGQDKEGLMVMVPLGMQLRPGVLVKFDDGDPINLPFTLCHPMGCTAEIEATKEIIEKMKKAKNIAVGAINIGGKTIGFRVPMQGFEKTLAGPPADNEKYKEERKRVMMAIRQRQIELAKKAQEEAAKKGDAKGKKK